MKRRITILALMMGALFAHAMAAAEITVLSAGAIEPGLRAATAAFEKATGDTVKIAFQTAPQIRSRIARGEIWDVVIAPPDAIEEFRNAGKVQAERVSVGRVGIGAAVRFGTAVPDISTAEALKRSVLGAESLVFNSASSGLYFESLLKKMGVYEQVERKTIRYADGASVMEHLLKGDGKEMGFGPITEILLHRDKGLRLIGPLPAEVQNYTSYTATSMVAATNAKVAKAFVQFLGSPASAVLFAAAGVER